MLNQIYDIAAKEVGYVEGANNANKYSAALKRPAESWCADFVVWCSIQAGQDILPHTPSCVEFEKWARNHSYVIAIDQIQKNDLILYDFTHSGMAEHIEIALGWNKNTHLIDTIGGNTSNNLVGSQSNGDCVAIKHRAPSSVRMAIRPPWKH